MDKSIKCRISLSLFLLFLLATACTTNNNADDDTNYEPEKMSVIDLVWTALETQASWIRGLIWESEESEMPEGVIYMESHDIPFLIPQENSFTTQDNDETNAISEMLTSVTYTEYHNARFSYSISYPTFLNHEESSINGDGCKLSLNEDIYLVVYGSHNIFDETIESEYRKNDIGSYVYSRQKNNWFVISDYTEDGKIFYQKTVLANNVFITAILYFPPIYKEAFDPIIKQVFQNFPK